MGAEAAEKLYQVLGVSKDASVSQIKKAYYREAKDSHPDKFPGDQAVYDRFQEVAEAYQTLADPKRRQQYDLQGLAGLAHMRINATRLFGPPPWRVLIGKTNHWLWEEGNDEKMIGLMINSIPNGIAGVTIKTLTAAYHEAMDERVSVLLERVSEEQAKDTVEALEEYGIAVKAEPLEGERSNEKESPLMYFRRIQRELGEASELMRIAAIDLDPTDLNDNGEAFDEAITSVRELRSELRAAARELQEFKEEQKAAQQAQHEAAKAAAAPVAAAAAKAAKAEEAAAPKAKATKAKAKAKKAAPAKEDAKPTDGGDNVRSVLLG